MAIICCKYTQLNLLYTGRGAFSPVLGITVKNILSGAFPSPIKGITCLLARMVSGLLGPQRHTVEIPNVIYLKKIILTFA